ncbi:MAG: M4 family metallopeptidase [Chloroflexota bacterium]
MQRNRARVVAVVLVLAVMFILGSNITGNADADQVRGLAEMQQDAIDSLEVTWSPITGGPTFISGRIPVTGTSDLQSWNPAETALEFLAHYRGAFGLRDPRRELKPVEVIHDSLGMTHVTFHQVYEGLEVYGTDLRVHFNASGSEVVAINGHYVRDLHLPTVKPLIAAKDALAIAQLALPHGEVEEPPKLTIYPRPPSCTAQPQVVLSWLVPLRDNALPARNLYVVDASDGLIIQVENRLYTGRDRRTYDAQQGTNLPGTLVRFEGDPPYGDTDIDNAHDFSGDTYDYYHGTHGRNSYDNLGASLVSTVHYGSNYANAFWNGSQMVYGDHFPVKDIVAHELTHAVTQHEANLQYIWQSGALNEGFSDIFAAMIDREDWLIGEDLPEDILGGQEAIRDMADPARFGQPGHADDWVKTCGDQEGVHINSGIPNKAYYNIATSIGKDKAEHIFYRTLTVYLGYQSTIEDARRLSMRSAMDLYSSSERDAVAAGWAAVGVDGVWEPEQNNCSCPTQVLLADEHLYRDRSLAAHTSSLLYRVRDELLAKTPVGERYTDLFYTHMGQITSLLVRHSDLRITATRLLQDIAPGLKLLLDARGSSALVTPEIAADLTSLLEGLKSQCQGSILAQTIEIEMAHIDLSSLVGLTFEEAWKSIQESYLHPETRSGGATILQPVKVAGEAFDDPRGVDVYPDIAYDPASERYLLVWLSARGAQSENDRFDVYGVFLDPSGAPLGDEFRISDDNNVARNGSPTLAASDGEFLVAWSALDNKCRVCAQRVTDASEKTDLILVDDLYFHTHSPSLAYNPSRQRYVLAYVKGDDYLPPTLGGADASDCGNDPQSSSSVRSIEFHFEDQDMITKAKWTLSDASGAFRPDITYSPLLDHYLIVWESRQEAGESPYRFDVYGRYLDGDGSLVGSSIEIDSEVDYSNDDNANSWTPRPAVAGGRDNFLATWFKKSEEGSAVVWSVTGSLLSRSEPTIGPLTIAEMTLAELAVEDAPTGFLGAAFDTAAGEYLAAWTSHRELFTGYTSRAAMQRITQDGRLLALDGSEKASPGSGYLLDSTNLDQLSLGLATNSQAGENLSEYMVVYARQATYGMEADFDIWGTRIQVVEVAPEHRAWLPLVLKD